MFTGELTVSGCCLGSWEKPLAEKSCVCRPGVGCPPLTGWCLGPGGEARWWSLTLNAIMFLLLPERRSHLRRDAVTSAGHTLRSPEQSDKQINDQGDVLSCGTLEHLKSSEDNNTENASAYLIPSEVRPQCSGIGCQMTQWVRVHSFNCQAKGLRRGRQRLQKQTLNLSWDEEEEGAGARALMWPTRAGQCIADATGPIKTSVRRELRMIYWICHRGMMPGRRIMRGRRAEK